jgi:hypothetical protein
MAFELNARELVLKLSHAAADKAPAGISNVLNFLIDELIFPKFLDGLIFPKKETDFFKQYEDRINKMIEKQIEASIGQSAVEQVKARLGGLGHAFKEYANVVDLEERKIRLGYLISLAELTVAEVESVPDKYLHLLTDALMLVAITHIAVLFATRILLVEFGIAFYGTAWGRLPGEKAFYWKKTLRRGNCRQSLLKSV